MNKIQKKMDSLFKEYVGIRELAQGEIRDMTKEEIERRSKIKEQINFLSAQQDTTNEETELRNRLYGDPNDDSGALTRGFPIDGATTTTAPKGRDYRSLFGVAGAALDRGGFKDFNEFLTILHSGRSDDRLRVVEERAMTTGVPSSGGFAVPEEFAGWLLDQSLEGEIIRPRATVWPMMAQSKKVPGWDMSTNVGSVFGGLTAEWLAEGGTATEVFAKLRQIQLVAKKLACYTSSSNELVEDGVSFEQQLQSALVKTIGFYLDYAFIQGSGAGQPLGIVNDPALIEVAAEGSQASGTIVYENLTKMFSRLAPQCLQNAVWLANQTAIPQLLSLSLTIGTGGQHIPVMTESGGKFRMLTKEVVFTEKLPALGSKGDILFADLSQYSVGLRREVSLDKSNAPGWLKDESSYRAIVRADGQGQWNKAVTPKHGDSLSWCVALAARS